MQFHANGKDLTWSTRQTTDIRKLSKAFLDAGFRAESDTSFGDSVMVVITPPGSDRSIKGQVLADGTIRLAGCRDDGEGAARCVAQSLNETGCLLGGKVELERLQCEVWLTKRHFQLCGPEWVIDMTALHRLLSSEKDGRSCAHPTMRAWISKREDDEYVRSVKVVGTACPRAEVKFMPVVVEEWEQVKRKPEPVSISIHHRGEVQLAGNAEYKVLQAYWFIKELVHRHAAQILSAPPSTAKKEPSAAASAKSTKRKLDVRLKEDAEIDLEPRSLSFTPAKCDPPPRSLPSPCSPGGSLSPSSTITTPLARGGCELPPLQISSLADIRRVDLMAAAASPDAERRSDERVIFGNSPNLNHPIFRTGGQAAPLYFGQPLPSNAAEIASPTGSAYHAQQMMCLAVLRSLCQQKLEDNPFPASEGPAVAGELCHSPTGEQMAGLTGRETPISPKRQRSGAMLTKPSPKRIAVSKGLTGQAGSDRGALELASIISPPLVA